MQRSRYVVLVSLLALALGACAQGPEFTEEDQVPADQRPDDDGQTDGDPGEGDEVAETVDLIAGDIYYENEPSELPIGSTRFVMENEGNIEHNLILEELGDRTVIGDVPGGQTGEGEVTLEAGEYTFYCSIPGHRQAGMEFSVTVE